MPPPMPVETTMARKSRRPEAAPIQPSANASALASLSTKVATPVRSRSRERKGNARHAPMLRGDTVSPPGLIGPPQPAPHTTIESLPLAPLRTFCTRSARRCQRASPSPAGSPSPPAVGTCARSTRRPEGSTNPAAIFVPPISMANANWLIGNVFRPAGRTPPDSGLAPVESSAEPIAGFRHGAPNPTPCRGGLRLLTVSHPGQVVPPGPAHTAQVALEHHGGPKHDDHADETDDHRHAVEADQDGHPDDESDRSPFAVPAGVPVHRLGADTLGEFGVLTNQGLLQLGQNALLVLRKRHRTF